MFKDNSRYNIKTLLKNYNIKIPMIQRDYAFGREDDESSKKRETFINALANKIIENDDLHLDFIYGQKVSDYFIPTDGQQRITTLWLIELYLNKQRKDKNDLGVFKKFSYETRTSSKEFSQELVVKDWYLKKDEDVKKYFFGQKWFYNAWKFDPTIVSMIVVLNEIHRNFKNQDLSNFSSNKITFSFLEISQLGKPEELYIKMNSRGKPLSDWEILKTNLFKELEESDQSFKRWFDNEFLDFFFENRIDKKVVENVEKSMFNFINMVVIIRAIEEVGEKALKREVLEEIIEKNWIEYLNSNNTLNVIKRFIEFFRNEETITQLKNISFKRFNKCGLRYDELLVIIDKYEKVELVDIPLFYGYFKFFEIYGDKDFDEKTQSELKQIIRIITNLSKSYRNEMKILMPFIKGLNKAISHESGILYYFANILQESDNFGTHSDEQTAEEIIKAKLILKNIDEDKIYRAESHSYFRGTIGFMLRMRDECDEDLAKINDKVFSHFYETGIVSSINRLIKHMEIENILLKYVFPRNDVQSQYAQNKRRDYSWERFVIGLGYVKNYKDPVEQRKLRQFYNYLFQKSPNRPDIKDYEDIFIKNTKLIETIGGIQKINKRIYGLKWDKYRYNSIKYDLPLYLVSESLDGVTYNGFKAIEKKEPAIYKDYEIYYNFEINNIEIKNKNIIVKTFYFAEYNKKTLDNIIEYLQTLT